MINKQLVKKLPGSDQPQDLGSVSYKDYETRARNLQLASILENVVIEKPHGIVSGRYFCGYMIFSKEAFNNLDSIKMSNRNQGKLSIAYEPGQVFTLIWRPPWAQFGFFEYTAKMGIIMFFLTC